MYATLKLMFFTRSINSNVYVLPVATAAAVASALYSPGHNSPAPHRMHPSPLGTSMGPGQDRSSASAPIAAAAGVQPSSKPSSRRTSLSTADLATPASWDGSLDATSNAPLANSVSTNDAPYVYIYI
jgi:hypothetical protein